MLRRNSYVYYLGTDLPNFIHFYSVFTLDCRTSTLMSSGALKHCPNNPSFLLSDNMSTRLTSRVVF